MTLAEKLRMARRLDNLAELHEGTPDLADLIEEQEQMDKGTPIMNITDARAGMSVVYRAHPMARPEHGVISKVGDRWIYVKFNVMADHGTACYPRDLEQS